MLSTVVSKENTASDVWADSAYRSTRNEAWLDTKGLFIRTIGLARAEAKLTLANIAYNFDRLVFHERTRAIG